MTLWSVARIDLGLDEESFWRLTPALFAALWERHDRLLEQEDWRMGMIAAATLNAQRRKRGRAFKPADFMPRRPKRLPTPKQVHDKMLAFAALFGLPVVRAGET